MAEAGKPQVLIVDPSLRSAAGHHLGALNAFRRELAKLGLKSSTLVSLFASEEFCREQNLVPLFEKSMYFRTDWTRDEFEEGARKFRADLRKATRKLGLRPDILILPAADQSMILGLARHLKSTRFRKLPEILIWLAMEPHFRKPIDDPSVHPLLMEYRDAFLALREAAADDRRIHVYCESDLMARGYEPYVGLKMETGIIYRWSMRARTHRPRPSSQPIKVVCIGNANAAKGYCLLPDAIRLLGRERDDFRFLIHGTVDQTDDPESWTTLQHLASLGPHVTVRTNVLSPEDYLAWFSQADFVLLPYEPHRYRTTMSGPFNEAEKLGIPAVATSACAFATKAIREGRAVGIDGHDAESVARAVLLAADRLDDISAAAADHAAHLGGDKRLETILAAAVAASDRPPDSFTKAMRRYLGL